VSKPKESVGLSDYELDHQGQFTKGGEGPLSVAGTEEKNIPDGRKDDVTISENQRERDVQREGESLPAEHHDSEEGEKNDRLGFIINKKKLIGLREERGGAPADPKHPKGS